MGKKKFPYIATFVGAFVLLGLGILFVMTILLAGRQNLFEGRFQVKAIFGRVVGLRADSPVRLAGIEVGNVEAMEFNDQGKVVVTMSVQEKYHPQIRKDSSATIGSVGLLGDKTVEISVGSPATEVVPPGGILPSQDPIDITEVLDQVGPTVENANKILANIADFTDKLKPEVSSLAVALNYAKDILEKVNTGQGTVGALINDQALYQQALDVLENGKKLTGSLELTAQRIDKMAGQISKMAPSLQTTLQNFQESSARIKESSADLKAAMNQLPTVVKKVDKVLDNVEATSENIRKASSDFPELVDSSREAIDEANTVLKATQKHWLLRRYVDKDETAKVITMDKRDQPYNSEEAGPVNRTEPLTEKAKKPAR